MLKPEMVKATHEDDIVYKRKKITLRSNYFNISLKMKALYMYRVEWGTNDRFAPIFKTKEEREAAFMDFCGQYINRGIPKTDKYYIILPKIGVNDQFIIRSECVRLRPNNERQEVHSILRWRERLLLPP